MNRIGFNITLICVVAILCVTALEIVALASGINGGILTSALGFIVSIPTFVITKMVIEKKHKGDD